MNQFNPGRPLSALLYPNCFNLIQSKWINTVRQIFVLTHKESLKVVTSIRLRGFFGFFMIISECALHSCLVTLSLNNQHCENTCGISSWKMQLFKLKTVLSHPLVTAVPIFSVFSGFLLTLSQSAQAAASFLQHLERHGNKTSLGFPLWNTHDKATPHHITCCVISH